MVRVLTGCQSCAMCTGRMTTGLGRSLGRGAADIATLGVSAIARKRCRGCGHPMSEHQVQPQPVVMAQPVAPPALPPGWYRDPTDARALCWWDGRAWHPQTKHYR